ncbi:MAG: carbon starvation protein A [Planctomycetes bacterium]|nr:carbon starvation protein A [Planctomycetota bacterium]
MELALLLIAGLVVYLLGIRYYSSRIAKSFDLDSSAKTPAIEFRDDVDFVPANKFYLLAQHFAAISAAGPIAGPILACIFFGWAPAILWIVIGAVFIGAVHDFSSLASSVKTKAKSIAEIVKITLGKRAYVAFILFIWLSLEYVIIAFTDVTAASFVGKNGPIIASSSTLYLLIGVTAGFCITKLKMPLVMITVIFVPLTFATVYLARFIPIDFNSIEFIQPRVFWGVLILGYCFIASVVPMWMLLQPRGYLGGFFLYATLIAGIIGIIFGNFEIKQPAVADLVFTKGTFAMPIFPFLFVTIACGACSGFHSLVCSGTTSKQISNEADTKTVGYFGMILESVMALIALATVIIISHDESSKLTPSIIYGEGIGKFLNIIGIPYEHGVVFGAMAFTTFVYDTLDVATRLGRYILQELLGFNHINGKYIATFVTCFVPAVVIFFSSEGSYINFWTLFGSSNQLLAALVLLIVSCWLYSRGKNPIYTLLPMIFMFVVTILSLVFISYNGLKTLLVISLDAKSVISVINSVISLILIGLSMLILVESRKLFRGVR